MAGLDRDVLVAGMPLGVESRGESIDYDTKRRTLSESSD